MLPGSLIIVEHYQRFRLPSGKSLLGQVGGADDNSVSVTWTGEEVELGVGYRFSQHPEMSLAQADPLQDPQVAVVFETHDGGASIPDDNLLKCQDSLDVPEGILTAEHAFESIERVLIEHSDYGGDAGRVCQHPQFFETLKEIPFKFLFVQKPGADHTKSGAIIHTEVWLNFKPFEQIQKLRRVESREMQERRDDWSTLRS